MGAWNPRVVVAALLVLLVMGTGGVVAVSSPDMSDLSDVLRWLQQLGNLDATTQRVMLGLMGQQMVNSVVTKCNVFGGRESCIELDSTSKFAHACVNYPLKVDCAFYRGALAEQDRRPDLRARGGGCGAEGYDVRWVQCELEGPILRTDRAAVWVVPGQHRARHRPSAAKDCLRSDKRGRRRHGGGEGNAQPREDTRAGSPVQEVLRGHHVFVRVRPEDHHRAGARCQQDEEHAPAPPAGVTYEQLFAQVKDTPLCDLYADETTPGFSGHCPKDPNALIGDTCGWCSDNMEIPTFVEEHLGVELLDGVYGWLIGPEGLLVDAGFLSRDKNVPDIPSEGKARGRSGGRKVLSFFLWLVGLGAVGGGAFFGYKAFRRFQEERSGFRHDYTRADFLDEQDEGEYTAAVDLDEL